jgi:hypothetical protein
VALEAQLSHNTNRTDAHSLLQNGHGPADGVLPPRANVLEHGKPVSVGDVVLVMNEQSGLTFAGKDEDRLPADGIAGKVLDLVARATAAEGKEHIHLGGAHDLPHRIPPALKLRR